LSYLRLFPFDQIKINRSFVSNLSSHRDCAAIVSAVARPCRLRIDTVTELHFHAAFVIRTARRRDLARAKGAQDQSTGPRAVPGRGRSSFQIMRLLMWRPRCRSDRQYLWLVYRARWTRDTPREPRAAHAAAADRPCTSGR
jgi:hypothetical protein